MPTLAERYEAATVKAETATDKIHQFVNGADTATVTTEGGPVPTIAKFIADEKVIVEAQVATAAAAVTAAKNAAEAAASAADGYAATAVTAKNDAVTAQGLSEAARDASVVAKDDSVAAKDLSVTAKDDAVTAKNAAEAARAGAEYARDTAVSSIRSAATTGGTANAITATFSPAITTTANVILVFVPTTANTNTTPTFNPDATGAKTIKKGGSALLLGDLAAGYPAMLRDDGTSYELLNPVHGAASLATKKMYEGSVLVSGSAVWDGTPPKSGASNWTLTRDAAGQVTVTHNLGTTDYRIAVTATGAFLDTATVTSKLANSFTVETHGTNTIARSDCNFDFILKRP